MTANNVEQQNKITVPMMIEIIEPTPIFMSSFMPAVTGVLFAMDKGYSINPFITISLLLFAILANATVDLLNAYFDYVYGNDKLEAIQTQNKETPLSDKKTSRKSEKPLVDNAIQNPKPVIHLAFVFTAILVLIGIILLNYTYTSYNNNTWIVLLAIGIIGMSVMLLYSGKYFSLSHSPFGEILSGGCLGGLLPFVVFIVLTGDLDAMIFFKSIPMILTVSSLCIVNNTCDIEKDIPAGRHTLPIVIGRKNARTLAWVMNIVWVTQLFICVFVYFTFGLPIILIVIFSIAKRYLKLFKYERVFEDKPALSLDLVKVAVPIVMGYPLSIAMHLIVSNILRLR